MDINYDLIEKNLNLLLGRLYKLHEKGFTLIKEVLPDFSNLCKMNEYQKILGYFYENFLLEQKKHPEITVYYFYFDANEYSGYNKREKVEAEQVNIMNSGVFNKHIKLIDTAMNYFNSIPILITIRKVKYTPKYVICKTVYTSSHIFSDLDLPNFCYNSISDYPVLVKAGMNNIEIQEYELSKAKWLKDIKNGKLINTK